MDYETFSWKDRCNRYFSSISDTAKDGDQEKDEKPEGEHSKEKVEDTQRETDDESKWKDLGEIKKKAVGGKLGRYVRKILNGLDIHGARFAGKTRHNAELVIWIMIIILATAGVFYLIFFTVREFRKSKDSFITTQTTSSQYLTTTSKAAVSFCNLNLLRKDAIDGTRFSYLKNLEENKPVVTSEDTRFSLEGLVTANSKLVSLIKRDTDIDVNDVVKELDLDIEMIEVLRSSNVSVDYRLGEAGRWDIVRDRIRPTLTEATRLGHKHDDMVVDCMVGSRACKESEIQKAPHRKHGNCFTVIPEEAAETVSVVLDAQSELYLHSVSPSVGFLVSTHVSGDDLDTGETVLVGTSQHTQIKVLKETVTERDAPCSESYSPRECYGDCREERKLELCGCRERGDEPGMTCNYGNPAQYVCVKVVELLHKKGEMACSCQQSCRDTQLTVGSSNVVWPSEYSMGNVKSFFEQRGKQMNQTQIRSNIVKISISLQPQTQETRQRNGDKSLLELLAQIGGLSALVVGVSAVTLLELLWTVVRVSVDFVGYLCKSSNKNGSMQRLTDSEITSITWAVYRQKRRQEEIRKEAERNAHLRRSQATIGGNVPSRLNRRNSSGSRIYEELDQFELRQSTGEDGNAERANEKYRSTHLNNNIKADRNGYRKQGNYNNRLRSISEEEQKNPKSAEGVRTIAHTPYYSGSLQSNGQVVSGDPRYRAQYAPRVPYAHPGSVEGVRLYGSSAAYFYNTTEPTYL